jgi:glucose-1-phosphatase
MLDLKNIRNIIFDLGGVLLNIDFQKAVEAFKELGIDNYSSFYTQNNQNEIFDKLEKGKISIGEFRNEIKNASGKNITDGNIDEAWSSMILDFPAERFRLLIELKKHFNTYLLSNTNEIHFNFYNNLLYKTFGVNDLSGLFDKEYYSHIVGLRKPDLRIFELVITENKLIPTQTLFIDDSEVNILAANKTGINTYLLKKDQEICEIFENFLKSHQQL